MCAIQYRSIVQAGSATDLQLQSRLSQVRDAMETIGAGGGDLTHRLDASGRDEIAQFMRSLSEMQGSLHRIVSQVRESADSIRVLVKGASLLIAGEKLPRRGRGDSSFHLVERGFGRFVRLLRLTSACDAGRARAVLTRGELRITVPKIVERRGRSIAIAITTDRPVA